MEYATLQNGLKMPMEGFGVFQVRDKEECKRSVLDAIRTGYRLIDTAASYTNEDAVGEAVREAIAEGICTREELFITSKMWVQDMQNYEMAKAAIGASLEKTGLEYLDLYLLHQAMKDYFSAWRAMEDAYRDGKLKAIGVSNFYPHVLTNFCETASSSCALTPFCRSCSKSEMHWWMAAAHWRPFSVGTRLLSRASLATTSRVIKPDCSMPCSMVVMLERLVWNRASRSRW